MSFVPSPKFSPDQILSAIGHLEALARNVEYLHAFFHHWQGVRTAYYTGDGFGGLDEEKPLLPPWEDDNGVFLIYERAFRHKQNTLRVEFYAEEVDDTDMTVYYRFFDDEETESEVIRYVNEGDTYEEFDVDGDIGLGLAYNDFYRMEIWIDFEGQLRNDKLEFQRAFETDTIASFGFETMQSFASGTTPTAAHWQQLSDNTDRLHNALVVPQAAFVGVYREIEESTQDPPQIRYRWHGYFTDSNQYLYYDIEGHRRDTDNDDKTIQIFINGIARVTIGPPTEWGERLRVQGTIDVHALNLGAGDHVVEVGSDGNVTVHQMFEMPSDSSDNLNENLLVNHAFTIDGTTTVFANWSDGNLTAGNTLEGDTDVWVHQGQSAKIEKVGGSDPYVQQLSAAANAGDDHWIEFYYKTGDTGAIVRVLESDLTLIAEYTLPSNSNVWTSYRALFTNPAGNGNVIVQMLMSETGIVNYDSVWMWEKQAAGDYERMPDFQHGNVVTGDYDVKIIRDNIQWLIDQITDYPYRNHGSGRWYRRNRTDDEFYFKHFGGSPSPLRMVRSRRFLYYYTIPAPEDESNNYTDETPSIVFTLAGEDKTHALEYDEDEPSWRSVDLDSITGLWPSTHYQVVGVEFAIEDDELY